jgi:hypothetical protein
MKQSPRRWSFRTSVALAFAIGIVGSAHADNVPGAGAGYFGGATYDSQQGSIVGPYPTWIECNDALQNAIDNAVYNFGWTVISIDSCGYNAGLAHNIDYDIHLLVEAESPKESAEIGKLLLGEVQRVRGQYRADSYEAALRAIANASGGK